MSRYIKVYLKEDVDEKIKELKKKAVTFDELDRILDSEEGERIQGKFILMEDFEEVFRMSLREREYRVTQLLELSGDKKSVVGVIEKKPIVNSARVYLKEDVDKSFIKFCYSVLLELKYLRRELIFDLQKGGLDEFLIEKKIDEVMDKVISIKDEEVGGSEWKWIVKSRVNRV